MTQVTITQLPQAGALTGTEAVPIVQNGVTVQTTTGAIAVQPTQTQSFLTVNQEISLPNSRYLTVGTGLAVTDNGAGTFEQITMTGAAASLNSGAGGIIVKNSSSTVVARQIAISGGGLAVSNADGTGGNPTLSLAGIVGSIQGLGTGTGFLSLNGTTAVVRQFAGTTNQINLTYGDSTGNPVISIAPNPILTGTGSITIPYGTTAQRPAGAAGEFRFNTDSQQFEGWSSGAWLALPIGTGVTTFSAGTTGFTPSSATIGSITLSGTLNVANGGTGTTTLTGYVYGNGTSAMTASTTIPNTAITGLGTMSTQNANAVAITGGAINGVTIGGTTAGAGTFTSVTTSTGTVATTPVNPTDIANKSYVDSVAQGLDVKAPVLCATTANITLSGEQTIDGITTSGSRVLVKNQTTQANNGIYVSSSGAWSRSSDTSTWNQLVSAFVFVEEGTIQADTGWTCTVDPGGTLGVTAVTWAQFSGAGTYTAGTGLTLTGTQFSITNTGVTASTYGSASQVPVIAINAQGQITTVTNTSIAISSSAVSGLAASATTDTTNASNISSGTLGTGRLSGSYTGITGVGTLTAGTWNATAIGVGYGGTGLTATPTNGQLAIGNGSGYTLATLTAGTNVSISNTAGGITISATPAAGGTVTSVAMTVPSFLSVSGSPITTSGTLAVTLSGTALPVANGGTGSTTLTGYVYGNGTGAMSASTTIPNTAITGLGTMSTQSAGSVAITGGTIDGTTVGATTASTVRGTTITATTQFSGPGTGLTGTASSLSIGGSAASATTATTSTNIAGGSAGAIAYNSASATTTFLTLGTTNYVLTAGASAPQYVAQSTLSVGSATTATNATNVAATAGSGSTNYIHFSSSATGNVAVNTNSSLTYNYTNNALTAGITGGTF